MMLIESGILLKNHTTCKFVLKYYLTVPCPFDSRNWTNQCRFELLSLDNVLINRQYLNNVKDHVCWNLQYVTM